MVLVKRCLYYFIHISKVKNAQTNSTCSDYKILHSGVPKGSVLAPFTSLYKRKHNFGYWGHPGKATASLTESYKEAIKWFTNNSMIANPGKFQAIVIDNTNINFGRQLVNTIIVKKSKNWNWYHLKLTQTYHLYVEKPQIS